MLYLLKLLLFYFIFFTTTMGDVQLKFISYNLHGFNQGSALLKSLCDDPTTCIDFLFTQESWICPVKLFKVLKISPNFTGFGISAMENTLGKSILRGRPFGGVATLINNKHLKNISFHSCSERLTIVVVGNYLLINSYLPTVTNDADLCTVQSVLDEIDTVITNFPLHDIVWGGDFNIDLLKSSPKRKIFDNFFIKHALVNCNQLIKSNLDFTYFHESLKHFSHIDHFLISDKIIDKLSDNKILEFGDNLSDHHPIMIQLNCSNFDNIIKDQIKFKTENNTQKKLRWDNTDQLSNFYNLGQAVLQPLYDLINVNFDSWCALAPCKPTDHNYLIHTGHAVEKTDITHRDLYTPHSTHVTPRPSPDSLLSCSQCGRPNCTDSYPCITHCIDNVYQSLVSSLNYITNSTIKSENCNFRKYWWNQQLDELKNQSITSHAAWINAGRPRSGPIFDLKLKSKTVYKKCINDNKKIESETVSNNLHDALSNKTQNVFWKIWRKKFGNTQVQSPIIDGCFDPVEITNIFAKNFTKICSTNTPEKDDENRAQYRLRLLNYSGDPFTNADHFVNIELLDNIIKELKLGKAAGKDHLTAEHFKYSHPIVMGILVKIFNLMLLYNYVPDGFGDGLTFPIPKSASTRKSLSTNDFRGITVSPIISKIFELCLTNRLNKYLYSSEMQFGFKKHSGCSHAIFTAQTTIEHFTSNNSTISLCSLDLSKAFDKVSHHLLFVKLIERNVPANIIKLLDCWYSKSYSSIKWHDCISKPYKLSAGVRQGGVLSPFLFAIYVDKLLCNLNSSKLGCHINHVCLNAIMYADDLLLLSVSISELQTLIDICIAELGLIDMVLNANKSSCMRIGKRRQNNAANLTANGLILKWCDEIHYLGITLLSAKILNAISNVLDRNFSELSMVSMEKSVQERRLMY